MQINVPSIFGEPGYTLPVKGFVRRELIHSDHDDSLDRMNDRTEKIAAAFGRLVNLLASRGNLSGSDVFWVAKGWREPNGVTLEDDGT